MGARYPHQRQLALDLGAHHALEPAALGRAVRRSTHSMRASGALTGGADVVYDCVGSDESLSTALGMVRPRGRVVLVGMPGTVRVDLASLWHREVAITGAYAYGTETVHGTPGAPSTSPWRWCRPSDWGAWCRRTTPSNDSKRRSPTPGPRAAAVR